MILQVSGEENPIRKTSMKLLGQNLTLSLWDGTPPGLFLSCQRDAGLLERSAV